MTGLPLRDDDLIGHADFVRRLARGLIADPAAAEDIAHDALLCAMTETTRDSGAVRAWFATTTRRLVWRRARDARRRARREKLAAREEAVPCASQALAHAEALQRVTDAVLALEPAQREVVLLRYYEGLDIAKIAARAGISVVAVRSRRRRAHESLRRSLHRMHGSSWSVALLGLAGLRADIGKAGMAAAAAGAPPACWAGIGAFAMSQKVKWGAALLLLLLLLGSAFVTKWQPVVESALEETSVLVVRGIAPPRALEQETARAIAEGSPPGQSSANDPGLRVVGRVFDERRFSVPGVAIELEIHGEEPRQAHSGADGRYEIEVGPRDFVSGSLTARAGSRGYVATFERDTSLGSVLELDVLLCPLRNLRVCVHSAHAPVADASILVKPIWIGDHPWRARATTGPSGDATLIGLMPGEYRVHARIAADGAVHGATALVEIARDRDAGVVLDLGEAFTLEVLCRNNETGAPVSGVVIRPILLDGHEGGGHTRAELETAGRPSSDAHGRARIAGVRNGMMLVLCARATGFAPVECRFTVEKQQRQRVLDLEPRVERELRFKIRPGGIAVPRPGPLRVRAITGAIERPDFEREHPLARIENGEVVVAPVPAARSGSIVVADGRGVFARLWVSATPGPQRDAEFQAPRTLRVTVTANGEPVAGLPLRIASRQERVAGGHWWTCMTDVAGSATFPRLYDARYAVIAGGRDIAEANLEAGDAEIRIERPDGRDVTVYCLVDGARSLPPTYVVIADHALVAGLREDPAAATLRFQLIPDERDKDVELVAHGPRGFHALAERIAPADGASSPLVLEWDAVRCVDAKVRVVPPSDGVYRIQLERGNAAGQWWIFNHYAAATPPADHVHRFTGLPPGLYRAHDRRSGVRSPVAEVRAGTSSVELELDLSRLALLRVRVTTPPGYKAVPIEVCDGERVLDTLALVPDGSGDLLLPLMPGATRTLRARSEQLEIAGGSARVDASMREVSLALVPRG